MNTHPSPTIKDIARAAGVHFSTVSLALRGDARIATATREQIVRLAETLHYQRDPVFMALTERRLCRSRTAQRRRIAFLSNHPTRASFRRTAHMRLFLAGAEDQAERFGYECELVLAGGDNLSGTALDRHLLDSRCDGVVLGALAPFYPRVQFDWARVALAKIDGRFMEPNAPFVSNDQMQVVRLGFASARALGYRRIGLAVGWYDEQTTQHMFTSAWAIEQDSLPPAERVPMLHFDHADTMSTIGRQLRNWVHTCKVEAVLCNLETSDALLAKAELVTPRDVAYASLSLSEPGADWAGVVQDHYRVGAKAVEMVAIALKTGGRGIPAFPTDTYVPARWHDGASMPTIH